MANVLQSSALRAPFARLLAPKVASSKSPKPLFVSFRRPQSQAINLTGLRFSHFPSFRFVPFASQKQQGETDTAETVDAQTLADEVEEEDEDSLDGAVSVEDSTSDAEESGTNDDGEADDKKSSSVVIAALQSYKEALASNDESKIAEIESFLKSIEDEKTGLEIKVASLSEELSAEKVRILRISADFDNFRKRTDRERISLVSNAQGEVVESLLGVLDNFERAKSQIKIETEEEEKISKSYQSIYKQFGEILSSLGVLPVETVGKPFDPLVRSQVGSKFNQLLDELYQIVGKVSSAIMREDSSEFEEGILLDEFRKGFKLGDRLLRPAMVKVSAGPGPAKADQQVAPSVDDDASETTKEDGEKAESA